MLDFLNVKFVTVRTAKRVELCVTVPNFVKIAETAGRMSNCVTVSNFVEIADTMAKIFQFLIFQDGGRRHLGFVKFQIFNSRGGQEARTASLCQISSKSL